MFELNIYTLLFFGSILILIEAFYSGSEIALLSADKLQLKSKSKQGNLAAKKYRVALELSMHPERILSSTLLVVAFSVISLSSLITIYISQMRETYVEALSVAITSPIIVIFGELLPKTIFQRYANQLAPISAYPILFTYRIFYPITKIISLYTTQLSRVLGPIEELLTGKQANTRESIRNLLSYGKKDIDLNASERSMIKRIFDFKDTEAKHALIPLVQVDAIEDSEQIESALKMFSSHKHSRMPVYSERIDNIVGILELHDLFNVQNLSQKVSEYMTIPHYAAETQSLQDLIQDMKLEDVEMVVVVDEYGGAVGILTLEDIVEEIVGEIQDEYDNENPSFKTLNQTQWLIQARMELPQLVENLGIDLPEGDYETLGGFLLQQFGRIPNPGDELYFNNHSGQFKFSVRKSNQRQIEVVLVEKLPIEY